MLLKLYLAFFKVGILSFGGGLAAISLIQDQIVEMNKWISMSEFTDLITIAQMTPGPIGLNLSTFVGVKILGISGGIVATLGFISPSVIIVSILAHAYYKYHSLGLMQVILKFLRPVVIAMILYAGFIIFKLMIVDNANKINYVGAFIFVLTLVLLRKFKMDPVKTMLLSGLIGAIIYKVLLLSSIL